MTKLALIGFGNVGRGFLELLQQKHSELEALGISCCITGVFSRRLGYLVDVNGLEPTALLAGQIAPDPNIQTLEQFLSAAQADVLFEISSLEPHTGQPAINHIRNALERGIHVVTANKGPLVHAAAELENCARKHNVKFRYEATFMGGIPIYSLLRECLPVAKPLRFIGLPNSTSTVILEAWEQGQTFDDGVRRAQALGIAETDPSMDVDGWDSAVKIVGLANTVMKANLRLEDCRVVGIRGLEPSAVRQAALEGSPYRLVARLEQQGGRVVASVTPERVTGIMAQTTGHDMMARFEFDVLPAIELVSRESGAKETAYDMLADLISILSGR